MFQRLNIRRMITIFSFFLSFLCWTFAQEKIQALYPARDPKHFFSERWWSTTHRRLSIKKWTKKEIRRDSVPKDGNCRVFPYCRKLTNYPAKNSRRQSKAKGGRASFFSPPLLSPCHPSLGIILHVWKPRGRTEEEEEGGGIKRGSWWKREEGKDDRDGQRLIRLLLNSGRLRPSPPH